MPKIVALKGYHPVTQGSHSAFGPGIVTDTHDKKLKPYRKAIAEAYKAQDGNYYNQYVPIHIHVTFFVVKPKKPKCWCPTTKGIDLDKCQRAVGDQLTGVQYFDDCQITSWSSSKRYCSTVEEEGLEFYIEVDKNDSENN